MTSFLLELPGELRNRVYALVLATDDNTLHFKLHSVKKKGKAPQTVAIFCTTAKQNVDPTNAIEYYRYDFNQLKNVCPELRAETTGLELRYNTLEFDQQVAKNPKPGRQFLWFIKHYPHLNRSLLRKIILGSTFADKSPHVHEPFLPEPTDNFLAIAKFCDAHPHVQVTYMLPPVDATRDRSDPNMTTHDILDFMDYGIFYSWLLYGDDLRRLYPKFNGGYWLCERLRGLMGRNEVHRKPGSWFVRCGGPRTLNRNLTFRIRDGELRESWFVFFSNLQHWNYVKPEDDCRYEWLPWARRWVNDGI